MISVSLIFSVLMYHYTYRSDSLIINEVCYDQNNINASWFELYNPTSEVINTGGHEIWFYSINGPVLLTNHSIQPGGFLVICNNITIFSKYWSFHLSQKIIEISFGQINDNIQAFSDRLIDENKVPILPANQSYARYRGGFDTDNFDVDFYIDENPTPGWENNRIIPNLLNIGDFIKDLCLYCCFFFAIIPIAPLSVLAWQRVRG